MIERSPREKSGTKYGELIADHDWSDDATGTRDATVTQQRVTVRWDADPGLEYRVNIEYSDHHGGPIASYAEKASRVPGSMQFEPEEQLDWVDLPECVRTRVAAVVAGVDSHDELDPGTRIINPEPPEVER